MKRRVDFSKNSVKDIYSFVHNSSMKMRRRNVRSRARKPASRKKVAVARKHRIGVAKRIAGKAVRNVLRKNLGIGLKRSATGLLQRRKSRS